MFSGIKEDLLRNNKLLNKIILKVLKEQKFGTLKSINHPFSPQGYTSLILLSESHLAIHTYPEHNSLYFSIYSCRGPKDAEPVFIKVKKEIGASKLLFLKKNKVRIKKK